MAIQLIVGQGVTHNRIFLRKCARWSRMDPVARTQAWRKQRRDEGKRAITVWLSAEDERRVKDLAAAWRCSPSTIMQQALAHFHPDQPPRLTPTDTDTLPIQVMVDTAVQAALKHLAAEMRTIAQDDIYPGVADLKPLARASHAAYAPKLLAHAATRIERGVQRIAALLSTFTRAT
jgi:hypothetical protein